MSRKGFTLIEMVIVLAILGMLIAAGVFSATSSLRQARNSKRISDLESIKAALEQYNSNKNTYPLDKTWETDLAPTYISTIPTDPSSSSKSVIKYTYKPTGGGAGGSCDGNPANFPCTSYQLSAQLEDSNGKTYTYMVNPYGLITPPPSLGSGSDGGPASL